MLIAQGVEQKGSDGRRIVGPVYLAVRPGSLVALMGPSGSGKSTLLRVLCGVQPPAAGSASWAGTPVAEAVQSLGYVPQRETLHDRLTVREALRYAAELRLPAGADPEPRVDETLAELDLVTRADAPILELSGGERRRATCGLELVGDPPVLLLDEPTSGLDVVLERRLMTLFRAQADRGRAVVVATHATASLELCDAVVFMESGRIAWQGPPALAAERLRVPDPHSLAAPPTAGDPPSPRTLATDTRKPFLAELRTLVSRGVRTLLRDRRTLTLTLGQAPLLGLLIAVIFHAGAASSGAAPIAAIELTFLLMTGAIWLGVISSTREVVKERALIEREFDVGVRLDAYIAAKAAVLLALNVVQVLLLMLVLLALQPLGVGASGTVRLFVLAVLTAWAGGSLGLAVSCLARNGDQAAGSIPLLLMPQLLLAGGLLPLAQMPAWVAGLANLVFARWSYAAMGSVVGIGQRLAATAYPGNLGYGTAAFTLAFGAGVAVLLVFTLAALVAAVLILTRRAVIS